MGRWKGEREGKKSKNIRYSDEHQIIQVMLYNIIMIYFYILSIYCNKMTSSLAKKKKKQKMTSIKSKKKNIHHKNTKLNHSNLK